ncbi:hypothetical protein Rcae01_04997 [Novipirellula caenicola]|uniref:Uncharacterized protein n=1 Tax=Novipirellula caenicola TaxID=1536901 RepID=A0ABP9W0V5_9BACT
MDFLVRQWWIRRTRKSIVRLKQQAVDDFRYGIHVPGEAGGNLIFQFTIVNLTFSIRPQTATI